jgi:hypothetical protein
MIRPPAPAPPKNQKRQHMPLHVKLEAALRAMGLEPKLVEFQHDPPLALRIWVPERGDYDPPENDPRYIRPMAKEEHREVTAKRDIPAIAKTKRLSKTHEEFRQKMLAKDQGDDPPPPKKVLRWPKGRKFPHKGKK